MQESYQPLELASVHVDAVCRWRIVRLRGAGILIVLVSARLGATGVRALLQLARHKHGDPLLQLWRYVCRRLAHVE
jgi:hypothetical protein